MNIMRELFAAFEEADVAYLHFKSNKNLDKSFEGKADFDVLIDKLKLSKAEKIIFGKGGKRHNNPDFGNYPGVDNYLIFDPGTGQIYHLHLHCQLCTGKRLIKDYVIPWSDILLKERIKDEAQGIYISSPELELLLLSVRAVVKKRAFTAPFSFGMEDERKDLIGRVDRKKLTAYAKELIAEDGEEIADIVMSDNVSASSFARLSKVIRRKLSYCRRMSAFEAFTSSVSDYYKKIKRKKINKYFGGYYPVAKAPAQGGAMIAFVGIDGAGKSTMVGLIDKWIRQSKIEGRRFYMGEGDGKVPVYVSVMKKAEAGTRKKGDKSGKSLNRIYFFKSPVRYLKRLVKLSVIHDVEKNNRKKILLMNRYRMNGGISVCDRFPQIEKPDRNDGPKIGKHIQVLGSNIFTRHYEKKEKELMSIVKTIKPDLIIRMSIPAEVGLRRKGDPINEHTVKAHENKRQELMSLEFQGAPILDIDATMPFDDEVLLIKKKLWEYI